ncbi:hypothetical protein ACH5RR_002152 [Cinchona calisaya]|uniref:Magnesium transporter n=1 Tax=Cinchona calisaya TaxID=153742 RepID=A0ABD3B5P5_9GENT
MADDGGDSQPKKRNASVGQQLRHWIILHSAGNTQVLEAGKHAIMGRTGLTARDLRILDPLLNFPATLLGRQRAILVNMENIKAIITAHQVLLLNFLDPSIAPFVEELRLKILSHHHSFKTLGDNVDLHDLEEPQSRASIVSTYSRRFPDKDEGQGDSKQRIAQGQDGPKLLPFEFVVLEACLESACSCLDDEVGAMEQEVHTALNKLTSNITSPNLEHVQQIKGRLIPLTKRVQKVKDELENLLNDDEDMAGMFLSDNHVEWQLENSSISFADEEVGMDNEVNQSNIGDAGIQQLVVHQERTSHNANYSRTSSYISKHLHVEDLEMLLEAYFIQIDGALNKLSALREQIDDTEDYVNIMQDDRRNQLLQMVVLVMTGTLLIGVFMSVEGIFGMNIHIETFNDREYGTQHFFWMIGGGTAGILLLYGIAIAWYRHKNLL